MTKTQTPDIALLKADLAAAIARLAALRTRGDNQPPAHIAAILAKSQGALSAEDQRTLREWPDELADAEAEVDQLSVELAAVADIVGGA